jgi:flavin mononucleotide-binding protein
LLIPAAGMNSTETDLDVNNRIILTVGAREVEGFNGYQGTGFRITGTAKLIDEGEDYEMMKKQFSFLRKVLEIKVEEAKQLL